MAIELTPAAVRETRAHIVGWYRTLQKAPTWAGRYPDAAQMQERALAFISHDAATQSWGTTDATYRRAAGLVDALNGVAYHMGTVTSDGQPKARNVQAALQQVKEANRQAHYALWSVDPWASREWLW